MKIKDWLCNWLDEVFGQLVILICIMAAISIGVQSLLIWIAELFSSVYDCGVMVDAILGMWLMLPALGAVWLQNRKGAGNILVGLLAITGIYVSVVWYFYAGILVGCIVLLYSALWRMAKIGADSLWIYGGACIYLLYCIGACFAMIINGIEPAINLYGFIVLAVATLCIWGIPAVRSL